MDTKTEQPTTYLVPEVNYAKLKEQIAQLQKRAKKLGSGAVELIELNFEDWAGYERFDDYGTSRVSYRRPGQPVPDPTIYRPTGDYRRYFQILVTGDRPKLNGWQFAATLDAIYDEDGKFVGNLLRVLPGFELPEVYRTAQADCDHCRHQRNRKNTFIVKHEDGTWKQVGRQCIKDFLGHANPEFYARYAELLLSLDELASSAEDEDWLGGGGRGIRRYNVEALLQVTAMYVRADGWKPKAYETESTASYLTNWVTAKDHERKRIVESYRKHGITLLVNDADKQLATETMEWLESLSERENLNDYLFNLSILARAGAVEIKAFGFLASAVPAYLRSRDSEALRKQERLVSNYIGAPGEKLETTLTLKTKFSHPGSYGVTTKHKFHDEHGNVVIWWYSGTNDMTEGTVIKAKFTVKKHEEYNDLKQTTVLRLKVIQVISKPEPEAVVETAAPDEKVISA